MLFLRVRGILAHLVFLFALFVLLFFFFSPRHFDPPLPPRKWPPAPQKRFLDGRAISQILGSLLIDFFSSRSLDSDIRKHLFGSGR